MGFGGELALYDSLRRTEAGPVIFATIVAEGQSNHSEVEAGALRALIHIRSRRPTNPRNSRGGGGAARLPVAVLREQVVVAQGVVVPEVLEQAHYQLLI